MGLPYFASLDAAPPADLVFSAHSIEHVHDLNSSFGMIVSKVIPGGYIFFDTPNIEDVETFKGMPHTPHTYMLSLKSFAQLASAFSCEIVGADTVGPAWRRAYPRIKSDAKTDLRVLLRKKTGDSH